MLALAVMAVPHPVFAYVTLDVSRDRVFLSDGTVLECKVLCRGSESVIVLVGEREKVLPAADVVRVDRGVPVGEKRVFNTAPVGGHEQITPETADEGVPPMPPEVPEEIVEALPVKETPAEEPVAAPVAEEEPAVPEAVTDAEEAEVPVGIVDVIEKAVQQEEETGPTEKDVKADELMDAIKGLMKKFGGAKGKIEL